MKYLLFGDSICFGKGDYVFGGWASHFRKHIDAKEKNNCFFNLGIGGDDSRKLSNRIEFEAKLRIKNRLPEEICLIIGIGINDSSINLNKPENDVSEIEFEANILKLMKIAKRFAKKVIFLGLTPVDESKTKSIMGKFCYKNKRIKNYNAIIKKCANSENVFFKDFFMDLKDKNLDEILEDGIHPNTEGHLILFESLKKDLLFKGFN